MAGMRKVPIRNLDKVQAFLDTVPHGTKRQAIEAIAKYLVGDSRHGFKHDDPYVQTTRKAVYGRQWESDKQRRYVMARIRSGEIKLGQRQRSPTRQSQGYGYRKTNSGYGATIYNTQPSAFWTRVWGKWPKWRNTEKVIKDNIKGALRSGATAVNKWLRARDKK